jgi:hypothetical protein
MKAVGPAQLAVRRNAGRLLVLGLAIRECFSFWTGHPTDFELWVRLGYAVTHGVDPYGLLPWVPGLSFANVFGSSNAPTIAYLPLWPLITGLIYLMYAAVGWDNRFFYYFLLKQPVILADVGLAYLMFSYVYSRKPESAVWVLSFWLFSPFTIVISGIWGMFDSIAISLIFLSITSMSQTKKVLWEAVAILAKSIPIIYAAPLTMRRLRDVWYALISMTLAALLSLITFLAMHWPLSLATTTVGSTVATGGWSMSAWDVLSYMNYLGYQPAPSLPIYQAFGILWVPALIVFTWIAVKRFGTQGEYGMFQSLLVCTLIFLIFKTRITEQYALYLFTLAAIDVALWNPTRKSTLLGTVAVAMIYLVINNYFLIRFLSPVYPGFVNFENTASITFGAVRFAGTFLAGTLFTCLNVKYLVDVLRKH